MNAPQTYDAGVAHQIGRYADAIRVPAGYDQIVVSGTPGLDENGNIPADFADEVRQAWRNVAAILEKAGASISDIVSIRQYLTRREDIKTYVAVQKEMITHEPAGMLLVPTAMVWPEIHVEVEAVALVRSGRCPAGGPARSSGCLTGAVSVYGSLWCAVPVKGEQIEIARAATGGS